MMLSFSARSLVLAATLTCAAASAQTPLSVSDFKNGPGNGVYRYASSTPATITDLIQPGRPRPPATAQGELVLPAHAQANAKLTAVVLVHGSGGVYPEEITYWAKILNEQGIAAFVIDVFGPRGVTSTGEDQSQVPFAADTADAFAALRMLASHPLIDPGRIAVMGFSRGGATALRSAVIPIAKDSSPAGIRFAAHLAMYSGGCAGALSVTPKPGVFGPAPILFVHGDADDYTYLSDCKTYAERIGSQGTPTKVVVLPGARHKFDVDNPRQVIVRNNTKTREGCPLEYDVTDSTFRDRRSGEALSQEAAKILGRDLCADKGATMEGNNKARETAAKAIIEFLEKALRS